MLSLFIYLFNYLFSINPIILSDNWLNLPHYEIRKSFRMDEKEFKQKFGKQKPGKETEIIVYCQSLKYLYLRHRPKNIHSKHTTLDTYARYTIR